MEKYMNRYITSWFASSRKFDFNYITITLCITESQDNYVPTHFYRRNIPTFLPQYNSYYTKTLTHSHKISMLIWLKSKMQKTYNY